MRRAGYRVVLVRDPGSTALGRALRRVLLHLPGPLSALQEALLFIGGRVALVEERIAPALRRGAVVICDRFHDSTVVYQGFGGQLDVRWLDRMGKCAIGGVMPHLTILLDLPVAKGFARLHRSRDRMERKARQFHERVRQGYHRLARRDPDRFIVINASRAPERVRHHMESVVMKRLG